MLNSIISRALAVACVILFVATVALGQNFDKILDGVDRSDFTAVQKVMNEYYAQNPRASGEKQWRRSEWYLRGRVDENGRIPNMARKNTKAYLQALEMTIQNRAVHGNWQFRGPNAITPGFGGGTSLGRLNCMEVDTANPNIIVVGSSGGGVWQTTNGGNNWTNISPGIPNLTVGDLAMVNSSSDSLYLLTGDGFNHDRGGIGILFSPDMGETWEKTNLEFPIGWNVFGRKLLIHPTNPDIQYAVTSAGVYRTDSAWMDKPPIDRLVIMGSYQGFWDIEFHPENPERMYVSQSNSTTPIVHSGNGGDTWGVYPGTDSIEMILDSVGGIQLAVTPDEPEYLYAYGGSGGSVGLLRSNDRGKIGTWTVQDTAIADLGEQAPYNMSLYVDPENYERVVLGQVRTRRSDSGGTPGSWVGPSNYVHADVHESYIFDGKLYHANDGGLFISSDNGVTFDDKSTGLHITEIYRIAGTPLNENLFYCGTQDNGTFKTTGSTTFTHVLGADGMDNMIDYTNSNIVYASKQDGALSKSINGGASFDAVVFPDTLKADWVAPYEMDPTDPDIYFAGRVTNYRTDDAGATFIDLGNPTGSENTIHLRQGINDRDRLYVTYGSKIYRTDDALTATGPATWTNIKNELPDSWIGGIDVNHSDADKVYVGINAYNSGNRVFYSTSGGDPGTWQNISGSLPNVPINVIRYDPDGPANSLYLGTDIGMFYRNDNLGDWIFFGNDLPAVTVMDIYISDNYINAATFGRGLWRTQKYTSCPANVLVTGTDVDGRHVHSATNKVTSLARYNASYGTNVTYTSENYVEMLIGFQVSGPGVFVSKIEDCPEAYQEYKEVPVIGQQLDKAMRVSLETLREIGK